MKPSKTSRTIDPHTIAVLPLVNISPDPANEYICDGLSEELINGLTQIPDLRVVSRSSSFRCKGKDATVREIGRLLRARLLVHGSVRRAGDSLRLVAQLSDAQEGYQIWSQSFQAEVHDLFALQDELTSAVLEKLREQLGARFSGIAVKRQADPEAYYLYLQARFAFNQETEESLRHALTLFLRSKHADPCYAPALIGIAETYLRLEWYGLEPAADAIANARSALQEALQLEPASVSGLYLLGAIQCAYDWDWITAGDTFKRALSAGGGPVAVHFQYALDYLTPLGRLEEALAEVQQALVLDPLSPITNTAVGGCYYRMRRWNEAARSLRATLKAFPGFGHAHWSLGRVLLEQRENEEALHHFEEAAKIMGQTPGALAELGYCYARLGRRDDALGIIRQMEGLPLQQWVSHLNPALVYAGLQDLDQSMAHLEEAFRNRTRQLAWVNVDPRFDPLRGQPAFEQLISRLNLSASRLPRATEIAAAAATVSMVTNPVDNKVLPALPKSAGFSLPNGYRLGHYRLEEKIGEGGMGAVYRALDVNLNRIVALKVISRATISPSDKLRFAREAQSASALNHPNIVIIYEYNVEAGVDFIAMEYVNGQPLDRELARRAAGERVPLDRLLVCLRGVASALACAHQAGIVHRDLKPGNIMLAGESIAKVLDFGLAQQRRETSDGETERLTRVGAVVGTPGYMSPEQAMGELVDWRSDIFTFGIILDEVLRGQQIPPVLKDLTSLCLRKDRDDRLQSLADVVSTLDAWLRTQE
jgi:adenylate cyclase